MADDKAKKPKIDLKARLGRTTQVGMGPPGATPVPAMPGGAPAPPSSDPGGAPPSSDAVPRAAPSAGSVRPPVAQPMGIAPPPGLSPGIPLPPFARAQPQQAAPKPTAVQQTIKIEASEEIDQERKKGRGRAALAAAGGVVIGLAIGFVAGGAKADGDRVKTGAAMAGRLKTEVKATNDKLADLDKKLTDVQDKLKAKAFPDDLGTALGGLKIPFDSTSLDKTGISGIKQAVFRPIIGFARDCEKLDKMREALQGQSTPAKDALVKGWKEETAPMTNFSVLLRMDGRNVVAELVQNPSPFAWKGDQPDKYKVTRQEGGKAVEKEAKHFPVSKGDLGSGDAFAVPIDPKGTGALGTDAINIARFSRTLGEMMEALHGNDNPQDPKPGLLKSGEDLANQLQQASLNQ